jgi:hypothetical protein
MVYMLLLAMAQIGLALVAVAVATEHPFLLFYQLQLGCIAGMAFARFLWRVYPNSIEFFAHGISLSGVTLIPWAQVELRRSQYFADRLVVVLRPAANSIVGDTKLVQVSAPLREQLLSTASGG